MLLLCSLVGVVIDIVGGRATGGVGGAGLGGGGYGGGDIVGGGGGDL